MGDFAFDFEHEIDAKDVLSHAKIKADGGVGDGTTRGKINQVCKHWLRNLCMKGDRCDYLHQYDPNKMPECLFFLKFGKCTDPECVYRHVQSSERPLCQRYRLGFCKAGLLCRSRHESLPLDKLPEVLPDWFLDALLVNPSIVPRAEDVQLIDKSSRNGGYNSFALSLSAPSLEQGTIPGLPPPVHGKCRYFVIRSMNVRNVQISAAKGIWATTGGTSQKLRQGLRDVDHVVLVFAATESRSFHGYAKMMSEPDDTLFPGIWGDLSTRLSANFKVHWIKQCTTNAAHADHIKNPQNEDLPVRRSKDGQELPPSVGERLCRFLWQQPTDDLLKGSELEFEPRVSYEYQMAPPQAKEASPLDKTQAQAKPLALEDAAAEAVRVANRHAPVPLGTFQREAKEGKIRTGGGNAPVSFGKALASGTSSLLAGLTEEPVSPFPGPSMGAPWGPHPGWRPPPEHWYPPPGFYPPPPMFLRPPPPGYYPHPPGPCGLLPPHPGMEALPPGIWQPGVPERRFSQPPTNWEGASGAEPRDRSRSKSQRKKRKKGRD